MSHNTDIVFVVPALKPRVKEESMGTLILAKKAQLAGFNVAIARYWNAKYSPLNDYYEFRKEFIAYIMGLKPYVVSFYCRCEEYHICIDLSYQLKSIDPNLIISFGGPQAELVAKETIDSYSFINYVCCSEGENTIVPFLTFVLRSNSGLNIKDIPGLTYKNEYGVVTQNPFPEFLKDNYSRQFYYHDLIPPVVMKNSSCMPIDVGRGCPFSCTYCSTKTFWKRKYRLRNLDDIISEIEYVVREYSIHSFDFMHDLFTVNRKRIIDFCQKIADKHLRISWGCDSRIDTVDTEIIDRMVSSGLTSIFFGIETGSPIMQNKINKRLNLEKCDEIVKYCIAKGLKVTTSFIYGFPEETEYDIDLTLKMAIRFQNYGCNVLTNMCHIMNGTELYEKYGDTLFLSQDTSYNSSIIAFKELLPLISGHKQMFANFCDYPNHLRNEMAYFDIFRYTLNYVYSNNKILNDYLHNFDYASLSMYRLFFSVNQSYLENSLLASDGNVTNMRHNLKKLDTNVYSLLANNLVKTLKEKKI